MCNKWEGTTYDNFSHDGQTVDLLESKPIQCIPPKNPQTTIENIRNTGDPSDELIIWNLVDTVVFVVNSDEKWKT